jgi:hypothetical protein
MKYSRLESTEEKRNLRSAVILIILSIAAIILLFIFGIPAVGKIASFVSGLRGGTSPITSNDKTPPAPPSFNTFPDFTNQSSVNITGSAEPGTTVKLTFDEKINDSLVDKDGNFSFPNLVLQDGNNVFSAVAVDNAGNISQKSPSKVINYDVKPPDLNIDNPQDGTKLFGSTQRQINIQGSTENSASVTINDRIVTIDNNGKFQYPVTLNGGDNMFTVKAVDPAGNTTEKNITLNFND